jgi:thiamine transport system permease protein
MIKSRILRMEDFIFLAAALFLLLVIFLPAVYILRYSVATENFFTSGLIKSILLSVEIGLAVTFINIIFGLPLAWIIVRSKSRIVKLLDSLIDLSLIIPTAALGLSVYLYWGSKFGLARLFGLEGGIFSKGPFLIILLHVVFTLPYMIRSIASSIVKINPDYEKAALTLGANYFTIFRSIFLPLFKEGIIVGSILSFTRSLSETGATMMVAGAFTTAPVLIIGLKQIGQIPQAAGASIVMILSAITILFLSKLFLGKKTTNFEKAYPNFEKSLLKLKTLKNVILALFFIFIIFLPTVFLIIFNLTKFIFPIASVLIKSLFISFSIAFMVALINLFFSIPLAYLISRNKYRVGNILDVLNDIVLLVPTSALGLSLFLFWQKFFSHEFLILILAHLSFTFPLMVKPLTAAFKNIPMSLEEASYSLGANKVKTFKTTLLPLIKPAVIAGFIMAFMRSLSETGATLAITSNIKTIPLFIVELVGKGEISQAAFACTILFIVSIIFLVILKYNKFSKDYF